MHGFPLMDISEEVKDGGVVRFATGDIPDYYHRLLLPPSLAEFFVVEGISPKELGRELRRGGFTVDFSEEDDDGSSTASCASDGEHGGEEEEEEGKEGEEERRRRERISEVWG